MHPHTATFSVIIPTYNRAALTARAVDSVLDNESCGPLEVLVVDDASSDDSANALGARYAIDPRVQLLSMPENRGPSAARNRGIGAASGAFILFLDSDDILLPQALAFAHAAFNKAPKITFLSLEGESISVNGGGRHVHTVQELNPGWHTGHLDDWPSHTLQVPAPVGIDAPPGTLRIGDLSRAILFGDLFFLSGVVMRRQAVHAAGFFNERFRYLEDWDFMVRVCRTGPGGYLSHHGFYREYGRTDQLSARGTPWRYAVMHQRILDTIRAAGGPATTCHASCCAVHRRPRTIGLDAVCWNTAVTAWRATDWRVHSAVGTSRSSR